MSGQICFATYYSVAICEKLLSENKLNEQYERGKVERRYQSSSKPRNSESQIEHVSGRMSKNITEQRMRIPSKMMKRMMHNRNQERIANVE
jgi:hypothetical protein